MTIPPTQAQIEAIRQKLWLSSCFRDVCQMLPCQCAEEIAALTAAAEVGTHITWNEKGERVVTAAAVGEQPSKMFAYISGQTEGKIAELEAREEYALGKLGVLIEENEKLRAQLAATIEQCAQVVETFANRDVNDDDWSERDIAAAIRAMKEET